MIIVNSCSSFDETSLQYWTDSLTTSGCVGDFGKKSPYPITVAFEMSEVRNAWKAVHVEALPIGCTSSRRRVGQMWTKFQRVFKWSNGSARHTDSPGSVSTPNRERLFWRSLRLRWLSFGLNGWENCREDRRDFSRETLAVAVSSSPISLCWKIICVVPCSVRPSLVYSWKSRLSNANYVKRPGFRLVGMWVSVHQLTLP